MRVLLCDLDDTLFDHQHATSGALATLRANDARLQEWSLDELKRRHHHLLEQYHEEVMAGRLSIDQAREARFQALVGGGQAAGLAAAYRDAYVTHWQEVPGALALLKALGDRGVAVVVVTNNIVSEQRAKLGRLGMTPYVAALVTSEEVGAQKPAPAIFSAALARVGATPIQAAMLGDAWRADIEGALACGIRPLWLNRLGLEAPDRSVRQVRSLQPVADVLAALQTV